jgi:hypothetical protein
MCSKINSTILQRYSIIKKIIEREEYRKNRENEKN